MRRYAQDTQVAVAKSRSEIDYMAGWSAGACGRVHSDLFLADHPDFARGHAAGRAAYLAAEQAERERLEGEVCDLKQHVKALETKLDSFVATVLLRTEPTAAEILEAFERGKADRNKAVEGMSSTQPDPTRRYR